MKHVHVLLVSRGTPMAAHWSRGRICCLPPNGFWVVPCFLTSGWFFIPLKWRSASQTAMVAGSGKARYIDTGIELRTSTKQFKAKRDGLASAGDGGRWCG
eukprot:Protomagalhaensia_sp_Gyna_25__1290@NODE_1648_length_1661_cov_7_548089_g1347_i0_p2_GENE_NODE_1648_length_1661_cov_7_548089_g1347_i0NODE_1648_length_1661_cov_7_548089_g1347_i0_p2_ORF_typecomplete_len100_score0_95Radical_SAM_C/PF16199_5/0_019_NODE_1648_length_1661_cov_7_548089_g1347_i070369